jgi:hypothetical protein
MLSATPKCPRRRSRTSGFTSREKNRFLRKWRVMVPMPRMISGKYILSRRSAGRFSTW